MEARGIAMTVRLAAKKEVENDRSKNEWSSVVITRTAGLRVCVWRDVLREVALNG